MNVSNANFMEIVTIRLIFPLTKFEVTVLYLQHEKSKSQKIRENIEIDFLEKTGMNFCCNSKYYCLKCRFQEFFP